jgi:hypothetical protein
MSLAFVVIASKNRETLWQYKEKKDSSRVPLVTIYYHILMNLKSILRENLSILHDNGRIAELFRDPFMAAFRRPRNLKNMAMGAK